LHVAEGAIVKYCPNCGAGVEAGAYSCESCGAGLAAVRAVVDQPAAPPPAVTVADLSPRQLRKEIRWGVFQGVLLVGAIVFLVYLVIFLIIAIGVGTSVSGFAS
jgi:uncharacterized membrane protein YvbJ